MPSDRCHSFGPERGIPTINLVWNYSPSLWSSLLHSVIFLRASCVCRLLVGLILIVLLGPLPAFAQANVSAKTEANPPVQLLVGEDILTIKAVHQEQTEKHKYRLRENAEIDYRDMKFFGDEMTYDDETGDVEATGHVKFEREVETITGTRLKMNVVSKTGVIYDGKGVASRNFYFQGAEIYKIGEDRYKVIDGSITACKGDVPKWSFKAKSAIVRVEKTVTMRDSTFKIKRFPIFFSPFLAAPVTKRERQTGFLIPSTGNSTLKGRTLGDAFFWAINRSVDLLFTGEYYSARGWAEQMEFRAVPSKDNFIDIFAYNVNDKLKQGGQSAKVSANYLFSNGFRAVADVNYVSSLTFRQIFGDSFNSIVLPDQTSQIYLERNSDQYSMNFAASRYQAYFDQGSVTLRRFPAAEFTVLPHDYANLPFYFSWDSSIDGINRQDPTSSTPNISQRFDFAPRITFPLQRLFGGYLTPSFEVRETVYRNRLGSSNSSDSTGASSTNTVFPGTLNRTSGEFRLDFRGFGLEHVYDNKGGWFGDKIKHVIEPEVTYRLVRGIRDVDQIIRFDERDVLVNTNEIEYGVTNRIFTRRDKGKESDQARELLSWKVSQKYFFDPTFGGAIVPGQRNVFDALQDLTGFAFADGVRHFSPIVSLVRFSPKDWISGDYRFDYDTKLHEITSSSVTANINQSRGFLSFTYFVTRNNPPLEFASNQLRTTFGIGNFNKPGVSAAFSISYDIKHSTIQNTVTQLGYNWDCCGVIVELRQFNIGIRNETQYRFSFSLLNVGSFGNLKRQERLY